MYEWLRNEITQIRTPKFHLVDGHMSPGDEEAVRASTLALPQAYKEFVVEFGNAKLYRQGSIYLVQVYASPREADSETGEPLVHFGRMAHGLAYFKQSLLLPGRDSPVFEWTGGKTLTRRASGFEEWLERRCRAARKSFPKEKWSRIVSGPEPFTASEQAIIEARRCYRWRVAGVTDDDSLLFEVHNGSNTTLHFLSVGIRKRDGTPIGGVWLPVSHIRPGMTAVVKKDCYRDRHRPSDIEAFELPDPGPEDRDRYWEFETISSRADGEVGPENASATK